MNIETKEKNIIIIIESIVFGKTLELASLHVNVKLLQFSREKERKTFLYIVNFEGRQQDSMHTQPQR